jgi:N-acetylglucosaminyldiphosphoundecaprenol N-acetyl-beta-D-mannosaminyltransferase
LVGLSPTYRNNLPLHEQQQLEELIRTTRPGVVAVFLGAPRQEMWIAQNRELLLSSDVRVAAGLGGTVDFLSGDVIRAPKWVQAIGIEWAFRLAQEPRRLKRQASNLPEFALRAIFSQRFVSVAQSSEESVA